MSKSWTVDRNRGHRAQARRLLWPVAVAVFLFTVSYPANDFVGATSPTDIGLGMFLVYAGIAAVTVGVVFALVLPGALRREGSGGVALALAIPGTLLAPGFWTGFPPGLAARGCVARLGWNLRGEGSQAFASRICDRCARCLVQCRLLRGRVHLTPSRPTSSVQARGWSDSRTFTQRRRGWPPGSLPSDLHGHARRGLPGPPAGFHRCARGYHLPRAISGRLSATLAKLLNVVDAFSFVCPVLDGLLGDWLALNLLHA